MKIVCQTQQLNRVLQLLKLPSDRPREIFMKAQKNKLQLGTIVYNPIFDHIVLYYTIPAEVKEPGFAAAFAEPFENVVSQCDDDPLHLSFHEWHNRLDIRGKGQQHSLNGRTTLSPHPELLKDGEAPWYSFDASHLCQGLKRVLFAALTSPEEQSKRPFISGVLLHRHEGQDRMVATDGRRVAMSILVSSGQPTDIDTPFPRRVIPYPACTKIVDVIESLKAKRCRLQFGQKNLQHPFFRLSFECGDFSLQCVMPKEDCPDYFTIKPESVDWSTAIPVLKLPLKVRLNRKSALWAVKIVEAVKPRDNRTEFHIESGTMRLEAIHPEFGQSQVQIPIQYSGSETFVTFNSRFIKEAIAQAEGEEVTFHFNKSEDRLQPAIIELGSDFYYLVMPMR